MRFRAPGVLALIALLLVTFAAPSPVVAEFKIKSFKTVKPPKPGARRLSITTSIVTLPEKPKKKRRQNYAWFWNQASPRISAANPARAVHLAEVVAKKSGGGRKALIRDINEKWGREIAAASRAAQISEPLLLALIAAESGGNPRAISSAGAQGLGQLMPGTAKRFNVADPFNPAQNLSGAARYLSLLLRMFREDTLLALAGYNAGENAVKKHKGVPPYAETRDYVPIVLGYYDEARKLCATAPKGPRTPCKIARP